MWKWFTPTKKLVGTDLIGNKYYTFTEDNIEKREVEFSGDIEQSKLPPIWRAWLNKRRPVPPTHEEMMQEHENFLNYKKRVSEIEAADNKLRLQEIAERNGKQAEKVTTAGILDQMIKQSQPDYNPTPKSPYSNPTSYQPSSSSSEEGTPIEEFIPGKTVITNKDTW